MVMLSLSHCIGLIDCLHEQNLNFMYATRHTHTSYFQATLDRTHMMEECDQPTVTGKALNELLEMLHYYS